MTETISQQATRRPTPEDATEFEREQLRFFLSGDDLATTLATINPSLAWLPVFSQMKLIKGETQLATWIERNFSDVNAVREVVANIRFFGPETANILEYRLNRHAERLPSLLVKCWRLIIRFMRRPTHGLLRNEWYEIFPHIKRGEVSADLLERITNVLRPKLTLGKRFSYGDSEKTEPEHPSDLMSIDYEVDDGITADDVLAVWPETSSPETDSMLLTNLTAALGATILDAIEVGVESNEGYRTSDSGVPSVAKHGQNTYRSGFHSIVRVIAELWTRLARKSAHRALAFVDSWRNSPYRLVRRLALFSGADPVVSPDVAADILLSLPVGELFLTGSSVEVYRLIRSRWNDFPGAKQTTILSRFCDGPPRSWFREGSEIDRAIDRCRFDVLGQMEQDGFQLGPEAKKTLEEVRLRWPQWQLRPAEQAGFHIWHESGRSGFVGDSGKLQGVSSEDLVSEARKAASKADFHEGDAWRALCMTDPDHALSGLDAAASSNDWPAALWQQLLWTRKEYTRPKTKERVAQLLLQWPGESFSEIAAAASSWLNDNAKTLDDSLLWPLWDRIANASLRETEEAGDE